MVSNFASIIFYKLNMKPLCLLVLTLCTLEAICGIVSINNGAAKSLRTSNLVQNGAFRFPTLIDDYIIYKKNEAVPWISESIEIGKGKLFNSRWASGVIVGDLDGEVNGIVYQTIKSTTARIMTLTLEWTAREGHPVETSRAQVLWNNKTVLDFQYMDWNIYSESVEVNVLASDKNEIRLIGLGESDGFGVTVTNIAIS